MTGGSPWQPIDSPETRGISVRGGIGGIRFQWEELTRGAAALERLADDTQQIVQALAYLSVDLQRWRFTPVPLAAGLAGAAGAPAADALESAREAVGGLEASMRGTSLKLRTSHYLYETAEDMATIRSWRMGIHPLQVWTYTRALAGGLNLFGLAEPGSIDAVRQNAEPVRFDGSVAGLIGRQAAVQAGPAGTFEILEVDGTGGRTFVITLPGTQSAGVDGSDNPFDEAGIAEAIHFDSRYVRDAVLEALLEVGAAPGDRLVLAGYSQGGIHAVNLAASRRLQAEYDVTMVVTAGSPTGSDPTGEATYLHLEHEADWVPAMDAALNPDQRNRTTVTVKIPVEPDEGGNKGLGPGHKLANYVTGAAEVDRSAHPSLTAATGLLAGLARPDGRATRHVFTATRRASPRPAGGKALPAGTGQ